MLRSLRFLLATATLATASLEARFLGELRDYYGGANALTDSWLYPINDELLDALARKMTKPTFVVGVVGSSVAAGHDNCNDDSYEKQLERSLQPLFAARGKVIEVRNAGQGGGCGDTFHNQIWCLRHLVGDDVDAVHYTWTYFESGNDVLAFHELFLRWSLSMPNTPVPLILNLGDGRSDRNERLDQYRPFGYNALYLEKSLLITDPGYGRKWGAVGDGLHNATRHGRDGVVWRNWHPGPLGFERIADAMAYVYATALSRVDAVDPVEPRLALPVPAHCDPAWCGGEALPNCVTFELPTYGQAQIAMRPNEWASVKPATSTLMPRADRGKPECEHLDYCSGVYSSDATWARFELPPVSRGKLRQVFVCCGNHGKHCGAEMLDFEFRLDDVAARPQPVFGKCIVLDLGREAPSPTTLSVRGSGVLISHVFTTPSFSRLP